jgi:hypothetical protein
LRHRQNLRRYCARFQRPVRALRPSI